MTYERQRAMIRTLLAVLVALLCAPSAAQAGPWELGRAMAVASKAWSYPCGGRPAIEYSDTAPGDFDAWVYFIRATPASAPVAECRVFLAEHMHDATWEHVCRVVLHEYGHLAGIYEHSADPTNIMAELPPNDTRCAKRGRPFLGLAEPRTPAGRARFA